ncbi:MAG TPA: hypothetical protein VE621_20700 [Bryobacteraceae bacterium]|jgi:hypothetical protein|nr:hypothetical protein [Bryobacteraceae bacterium]
MNRMTTIAAATAFALVSTVSFADQWNKRTILTVNEPIQVPGAVLQPGKYVMKLMDSPANRHIVQVFNEREDQLITTVLAIPNYRLQPTGETEFGWWETPAGQPKAMRAWFYPGDNFGQEFAYPKNMSVQLASTNNANVPTTYSENKEDLASARVGTVDKSGTEAELGQDYTAQATPAPEPAPAPSTVTEPEPAPQTEVAQTPAPQTLPQTSSPFPLVGLAGFAALGASMAFRAISSRR